MSLSAAIQSAQASLSNTATQTSLVSRNITNSSNPDYNRRSAALATSLSGAQVVSIQRAQDQVLFRQSITGTASASGQQTLLDGLSRLKDIYGGNDYETSPATLIANMRDTMATFAAKPGEATLAETTLADANLVAAGLRSASAGVQNVRYESDRKIKEQVDSLNEILSRFRVANSAIVAGTKAGQDVSTELDERDGLLRQISSIIGVSTVTRTGNDIALYTTSGATLFETVPREVSFVASGGFSAAITGNQIYIDGVPLQAGEGATTTATGSLQALVQVRDVYAPDMQRQLDEIARVLVTTFAEKDRSAVPALPDMPGLFTWSGGIVPAAGVIVPGISATISLNSALILSQGGDPRLLRDGGINGAAYVANPAGAASFSALLDGYVSAIEAPQTFDATARLGASGSLSSFAAQSIGWLELNRSEASSAAETREAYRFRTIEAYSNATGVSLDEEMSILLQLEQSYKASARLISAVDQMLQELLAAVR